MKEFLEGLKLGYERFALISTDSGSYGRDIQTNLVKLLREMISVEGECLLSLRNVHPRALIKMLPEFLEVFKSGKIVHMTTAAQHGNNRILQLMKRDYKIEDFKFAINAVKQICPKLKIRTQLMAGFPGETNVEFSDTLKLLDEIQFDFIEVYKYSPRPNTLASEMPNQVTNKIANKRYLILYKKVLDNLKSGARHN
jgi:tRNA A37 methylthiotransferase MiaB